MSDGLDRDRIPPDPATLITALARALADVHLGHVGQGCAEGDAGLVTLDHRGAAELVAAAVRDGWVPSEASPYRRAGAATVAEVVADAAGDIGRRSGSSTTTIGRATFANLVLAVPDAGVELSASSNLTFRRTRSNPAQRPTFATWSDAASSDPYRDLALAAADVIATFGPGAVLGFVEAYSTENPSIDPIDPLRLDWWSMVVAVIGSSTSHHPSGPAAS